jgi:hypothetical protein
MMSSALFWVDFFMNPYNIFMMGLGAGSFAWFVSGGLFYTFGLDRRIGIKVVIAVAILVVLVVWGLGYGLVIWYNTPMGPPLELNK